MKTSTFKYVLLAGITFCSLLLLNSCNKNDSVVVSTPAGSAAYNYILDRDLLINSAVDDGTNITAHFNSLTFHFTGPSSSLNGTATAANTLLSVNGTWTINSTYDKITFSFPTGIFPDLAFLNKQWIVTSGSAAYINLAAANGESDTVQFSPK